MIGACDTPSHGPRLIRSCAVPPADAVYQKGLLQCDGESSNGPNPYYPRASSRPLLYVTYLSVSAPDMKAGVIEGYTYVVAPSHDIVACLMDKTNIDKLELAVKSEGHIEWRVSGCCLVMPGRMDTSD